MTRSPMKLQNRELFGGAIELQVPADFLDVSDFRQVPDTQEVYTTEDGAVSLVVEILDVVKEEGCEDDLWKAINFHFGAIAHDNEAVSQQVTTIYEPSYSIRPTSLGSYESMRDLSSFKFPTPSPMTLEGTQLVRKFRSERPVEELPPPDKVLIFVALWRVLLENGSKDGRPIPEMDDDEHMQDVTGASAGDGKARGRYADVLCSVNVNVANTSEAEVNEVRAWFKESSSNMRIRDYGLFVEVEK